MMETIPSEIITFIVGILGFGGLIGFVSGYATKKIVKIIAILLGLIFILLQILAYNEVIAVNWTFLQTAGQEHLTRENLKNGVNSLLRILTVNLPFAGAFAAGFWIGIKKG